MLNEGAFTKEERTNAMLAHASIVLDIFGRGALGTILAFIIWLTQRGKSKFAARQAAQAVVYQLVGVLAAIVAWTIWGLVLAGSIFVPLLVNANHPESVQPYTMIPAFALIVFPIAVMVGWAVYGIYAAVQAWHGKDFSYPVIGDWIK
jgi:uncharacterized Tic20 family protein